MIKESYRQKSENELVKASLDGDKQAFGEIVTRYQNMVARTVKSMLGDSVFSEDIGQDVFIKLFHSLSEFRGEAKLSTYIQKIAVNLTLNEIKRRKRFFSTFSQKGNNEMYEFEVADYETEEKKEASELVNKALVESRSKIPDNSGNENAAGLFNKRNRRNTGSAAGNSSFKAVKSSGTNEEYFKEIVIVMKSSELKELIIRSLDRESDPGKASSQIGGGWCNLQVQ